MVQQAEALRDAFARRGLMRQAQAAERFRQEISEMPDTPEVLEVVTVYDKGLDEKMVYHHPSFIHDSQLRTVVVAGEEKHLTLTENRLLTRLEKAPNKLISSTELGKAVFGEGYLVDLVDNVRQYVSFLRQKMESNPNTPEVIFTVHGSGYRLIDPSRSDNLENEVLVVYSYDGGRITYYPDQFFALVNGSRVGLTKKENELLGLLAKNSGKVVNHETICREVWGDDVELDILKLSQRECIQRVRSKIGDSKDEDGDFRIIRSIRGVGYKMCDEDKLETPAS